MKNRNLLTKAMSVMLTLTLVAGMVIVNAAEADAAASGKLIKSVTRYYKNGGKWEKMETIKYTYNDRKDPVLIVSDQRISMKNSETAKEYTDMEYTYNGRKKVKRTDTVRYSIASFKYFPIVTVKYDSKGRPRSSVLKEDELVRKDTYTYLKNDYFRTATNKNMEGGYIRYKYGWNGKKPEKVTGTRYFDGSKSRAVENAYNSKGLLIQSLSASGGGTTTYKYKYKNGLVQTIDSKANNGNIIILQKYKITYYSDKKIPPSRYIAMINSQLVEPVAVGRFWY